MSLEQIIRPFQGYDPFNARRLPPQQTVEAPEDVETSWGQGGSGNYSQFTLSGLVGGTVNYAEKDRVTETVRIENPDDPSQFVDVERIKQLRLANEQGNEILFNLND